MRRLLSVLALSLLLVGCSGMKTHTEIEALNEAKSTGSPFTQRMTDEYRSYVKLKQRSLDYSDARHFARKGLMSAQGQVVMPEPLSNWHLDDTSARDLRAARTELLQVLNAGGRAKAPVEASAAQMKYDCWIEQEEQNWASPRPVACRAEYQKAFQALKARVGNTLPKSEKAGEAIPEKVMPKNDVITSDNMPPVMDPSAIQSGLDEGMFLAFFDFDSAKLNATGTQVVDAVAEQIKKRKDLKSVRLVGHTDSSGSAQYNMRLSARRADAVRSALASRGVNPDLLETVAQGENNLMVSTPNNTREPANRRVEVTFE